MMQKKSLAVRGAAICLAGVFLCGGAALATAGDRNDPLITLSYLTETANPEILKAVDVVAEKRQAELVEQFGRMLGQSGGTGSSAVQSASFTAVNLAAGQKLTLSVGCEVMLRSGAAKTGAAVADTTEGSTLGAGQSLVANHLYLVSEGQSVVEASGGVILLVRGSYTLG